jgi:hypothetical protein
MAASDAPLVSAVATFEDDKTSPTAASLIELRLSTIYFDAGLLHLSTDVEPGPI